MCGASKGSREGFGHQNHFLTPRVAWKNLLRWCGWILCKCSTGLQTYLFICLFNFGNIFCSITGRNQLRWHLGPLLSVVLSLCWLTYILCMILDFRILKIFILFSIISCPVFLFCLFIYLFLKESLYLHHGWGGSHFIMLYTCQASL